MDAKFSDIAREYLHATSPLMRPSRIAEKFIKICTFPTKWLRNMQTKTPSQYKPAKLIARLSQNWLTL